MRTGSSQRLTAAVRLLLGWQLLILVVGLGGCESRAMVSGKVTYKQVLLTTGEVSFIAEDGKSRSGVIGSDGHYEIADAPLGMVAITVEAHKVEGQTSKGSPVTGGNFGPPPVLKPLVPTKFNDPKTSGLTYEVTSGRQTKDLDLGD